ncbi:MAG: outer membrane lipoprotein LolB, partial [Burkholderiales bacterium]
MLDGVQVAQGSFSLIERERVTALDLVSPFGQTLARIQLDRGSGHATLEASDGRLYEAASVETLTERLLGWRVPVRQLADWAQGRAGGALRTADASGRMLVAADERWIAAVQEWGESRPRRISLRWPEPGTESAADGGARVRI